MGVFRMIRNAERNEKIISLRKAGKLPFEISRELGLSRNVVIGVCHRAGLCEDGSNGGGAAKKPGAGGRNAVPEHVKRLVLMTADRRGVSVAAREWGLSRAAVYGWLRSAA